MAKRVLGPAMVELVAAVEKHAGQRPLLVACSGGADSLALAAATVVVSERRGLPAKGLVIDHGLQKGSGDVAQKAKQRAERLGLPTDVVKVEVIDDGCGPEAAARVARHDALHLVANSVHADVLLGHTLDDQAETVLLGLSRGSGARSLSGMAIRRDDFVRPFLGVRRAVTEQACAEVGVKFWKDPHNEDPAFTRVRVRKVVLPTLEKELGPGVVEALARTASMLRDDDAVLDKLSQVPEGQELPIEQLRPEPALRRRQLRRWMVEQGAREPSYLHVASVESLVLDWHGQKWIDVPGARVTRADSKLRFVPMPVESAKPTAEVRD